MFDDEKIVSVFDFVCKDCFEDVLKDVLKMCLRENHLMCLRENHQGKSPVLGSLPDSLIADKVT